MNIFKLNKCSEKSFLKRFKKKRLFYSILISFTVIAIIPIGIFSYFIGKNIKSIEQINTDYRLYLNTAKNIGQDIQNLLQSCESELNILAEEITLSIKKLKNTI